LVSVLLLVCFGYFGFAFIFLTATEKMPELHKRFSKNCYVFKLTFENGTSTIVPTYQQHLGTHMLYQIRKVSTGEEELGGGGERAEGERERKMERREKEEGESGEGGGG
jgi:hypothetical protein